MHFRGICHVILLCTVSLCVGKGIFVKHSKLQARGSKAAAPWGLKTDPATGIVLANCGQCHSPYLITHHHRARADWDKTITKMVTNGMTPPSDTIRKMLLDYLEKHQGPLEDQRPSGSPWGQSAFDSNPLW